MPSFQDWGTSAMVAGRALCWSGVPEAMMANSVM